MKNMNPFVDVDSSLYHHNFCSYIFLLDLGFRQVMQANQTRVSTIALFMHVWSSDNQGFFITGLLSDVLDVGVVTLQVVELVLKNRSLCYKPTVNCNC